MPGYRRPLHLGVWALLVCAPGGGLWACGPEGVEWLLADRSRVLNTPGSCLWEESFDRLLPPGSHPPVAQLLPPEKFWARRTEDPGPAHTLEADVADIAAALMRTPEERREAVLARVRRLRASFTVADARLAPATQPSQAVALIPAGLPGEITDYLAGAAAYHEKRYADAREIWERLLARPAAERRQRSVWAAFMLGRMALKQKPPAPEEALRRFALARQLAREGFPDRLDLALASRGWEARAELDLQHYDRAAEIYFEQYGAGDRTAATSLDRTCQAARAAGREALVAMARSPIARGVMTASLGTGDAAGAAAWLAALEEAGVKKTAGADGLACVAYAAGDFQAARAWLGRAPGNSPMAAWIRAKLLLREGRVAAAAPLLRQASREHGVFLRRQAAGDAGTVEVSLGSYTTALEHFRAGYASLDAAYVAERLLSTRELAAFVDRTAPAGKPGADRVGEWEKRRLRQLLARRLAREGRYAEARRYLPAAYRPALDRLTAGLRAERQTDRPAPGRAARLFAAACSVRRDGMEILGTEIDPDWTLDSGMFDNGSLAQATPPGKTVLRATADERLRAARTQASPDKRFHYRYVAAGLARRAADLLPGGSEERARYLATAGSWLKSRDPEAALPFYRALVRCCGGTETGRAARAIHWFPAADACPATPPLRDDS